MKTPRWLRQSVDVRGGISEGVLADEVRSRDPAEDERLTVILAHQGIMQRLLQIMCPCCGKCSKRRHTVQRMSSASETVAYQVPLLLPHSVEPENGKCADPQWMRCVKILQGVERGEYDGGVEGPEAFCTALESLHFGVRQADIARLQSFLEGESLEYSKPSRRASSTRPSLFGKGSVIRCIAGLALEVPELFNSTASPNLLTKFSSSDIELSQRQCAALLALSFLGLMPRQDWSDSRGSATYATPRHGMAWCHAAPRRATPRHATPRHATR